MAHHEIVIDREVDQQQIQHAVPHGIPTSMNVGDTVKYSSSVGEVTIEFNELDTAVPPSGLHSPFNDSSGNEKIVVSSNDGTITVSNLGIFKCHCFLTPPGQPRFGWGLPSTTKSGGNHEVK